MNFIFTFSFSTFPFQHIYDNLSCIILQSTGYFSFQSYAVAPSFWVPVTQKDVLGVHSTESTSLSISFEQTGKEFNVAGITEEDLIETKLLNHRDGTLFVGNNYTITTPDRFKLPSVKVLVKGYNEGKKILFIIVSGSFSYEKVNIMRRPPCDQLLKRVHSTLEIYDVYILSLCGWFCSK